MNVAIRGKHDANAIRLSALLIEKCGFPDDGRWHHREYLHDTMLVSGYLRRIGISETIEVWGISEAPYKPRVIMRTIDNHITVSEKVN